jgi:hypothetical protein
MLFVIQFPLADSRKLIDAADVLRSPVWPLPMPSVEFVRYFGGIQYRKQGGVIGWLGENPICEAENALRFSADLSFRAKQAHVEVPLRCAFRRFFFDGLVVGKYEVGIGTKTHRRVDLSKPQSQELVRHLLKAPIKVANPPAGREEAELLRAGKRLARLYRLASTSLAATPRDEKWDWLVQAGTPSVYLEIPRRDRLEIPYEANQVAAVVGLGFRLAHSLVQLDGLGLHVWILDFQDEGADLVKARTLRMYLLRLHAEHECLRLILRNVLTGKIKVDPRSDQSDQLQSYFDVALKRIGNLERKSKDFDVDIIQLARESLYSVDPGQRDALISQLENLDLRRNLFRNLKQYVEQQRGGDATVVNIHNYGGVVVSSGGDVTIGGDVVGRDKINTG